MQFITKTQATLLGLFILLIVNITGCSNGKNEPSKKMIIDALEEKLPGYIGVKDIQIEVSENIRSKVEPLIRSRFSGNAVLEKDFVFRDKYIDKYGEEFKVHGISRADFSLNKWNVDFKKIEISQPFFGKPLYTELLMGNWAGKYICNGEENGMKLSIYPSNNKRVEALFRFYPINDESELLEGSYLLGVNVYNWGEFKFLSWKWLKRPNYNYITLSFQGRIDKKGTTLNGTFLNNIVGCSTFEVHKM